MGRPRHHDLDAVLDHARRLWVAGDEAAVTVRALSAASGVSNGALYHAFGSRDAVLARTWAREAETFLDHQHATVTRVLASGAPPADAVVAAALAPSDYARVDDEGARLLLLTTPDRLLRLDLHPSTRRQLQEQRQRVSRLVVELTAQVWERGDRAAVTCVRCCVVDLPGALLLAPARLTDPLARHTLEHAVRGVLAAEPPG